MDKNTILIHDVYNETLEDAIKNSIDNAEFDDKSYTVKVDTKIYDVYRCKTIGVKTKFAVYQFKLAGNLKEQLKKDK